jgi:thiamine biosynthesis protein ThiI
MQILVRVGELWLKSRPVQQKFERRLIKNIKAGLKAMHAQFKIKKENGALFVIARQQPAFSVLRRVFGISSFSKVIKCDATLQSICSSALRISVKKTETFAIRATRVGKHEFTSKKIEEEVGKLIKEKTGAGVNLTNPDRVIWIDVRYKNTYLFTGKIPGPGGMPIGTGGKVVALLSDSNSAVAAWLLMKRGCELVPLHINVKASTSPRQIVDTLSRWSVGSDFRLVKFNQKKIFSLFNKFPQLQPILFKRFILMVAEAVAKRHRATGIVTGETGISDIALVDEAVSTPVFRPLLGLGEKEINALAKKIGLKTKLKYEKKQISISDLGEVLDKIKAIEKRLDVEKVILKGVRSLEPK